MPRVDLTDKPIVITGASSGIGAAAAVACARAGMPVALFARRENKLEEVAKRVREAGSRAVVVVGSVDDPGASERLLDACESEFGPCYAALANAGYGQEAPCSSMSDADVRAMFETNFFACLDLARAAAARFVERGRGHVLLTSSCLSKLGLPHYGCYSATKACQDHFGRAMRHELRPAGVAVSTVHPIGTRTEFYDALRERSADGASLVKKGKRRFTQSSELVADRIVRQLRKGVGGEVWTSRAARLAFAAADAWPRLTDWGIRRTLEARQRRPLGGTVANTLFVFDGLDVGVIPPSEPVHGALEPIDVRADSYTVFFGDGAKGTLHVSPSTNPQQGTVSVSRSEPTPESRAEFVRRMNALPGPPLSGSDAAAQSAEHFDAFIRGLLRTHGYDA